MNIIELHKKLQDLGVPAERYFLHGLYGSQKDEGIPSLVIMRGKYTIEYQTYFREMGVKHSIMTFYKEDEACDYLFRKIVDNWTFEQIQKIEGLGGMTVNERLYASGLFEDFYNCLSKDKSRAKQILQWLRVDEPSIKKIIE